MPKRTSWPSSPDCGESRPRSRLAQALPAAQVASIALGATNGSISLIGCPKAIFGYALAAVSIATSSR